jgi:uncharacterized protein (DUF427 family)
MLTSFPDSRQTARMSLTLGHGPLSKDPAAANYRVDGPAHRIHFEPHPRRLRAELGGVTVLDTTRGSLLHESNILPVLYVPFEDIDAGVLTPTEHTTHCPFKGDASYWTMRAGGRELENAVWGYEDPLPAAPWLRGQAALYFDRMDRWLEEDEEIAGHLRDPYHRVDVRRSSRSVEVLAGDELVVGEAAPLLLFETGLPVRAYLSPALLDLEPSPTRTVCPYKGEATYWSLRVGGRLLEDAAWSYEAPLEGAQAIAGLVALAHDELTVRIAG